MPGGEATALMLAAHLQVVCSPARGWSQRGEQQGHWAWLYLVHTWAVLGQDSNILLILAGVPVGH